MKGMFSFKDEKGIKNKLLWMVGWTVGSLVVGMRVIWIVLLNMAPAILMLSIISFVVALAILYN